MSDNIVVEFIVEYDDGSTARMAIDRYTLGMGDFVARIVAWERILDGTLPDGIIISVRRAALGSSDDAELVFGSP